MAEYVVCSSCGARIKATRQRCLRCLEPLHGDETPSYPSLSLSRVQTLTLAGGVSLAVLTLVVALWWTRPDQADPVARPYSTPSSAQPAPAPAAPSAQPAPSDVAAAGEVAAASDVRRNAGAALTGGNLESARASYEAALW